MIDVRITHSFQYNYFRPTPEQSDFIRYWQPELEKLATKQILQWALERFHAKLALVTSCGIGGSVLISLLGKMETKIPVVTAEEGARFGETKRLYDQLEKKFGVTINGDRSARPSEIEKNVLFCCGERKYNVLRRNAAHFDAWISEARRDHFPESAKRSIIDWDYRFGLFRISPLMH